MISINKLIDNYNSNENSKLYPLESTYNLTTNIHWFHFIELTNSISSPNTSIDLNGADLLLLSLNPEVISYETIEKFLSKLNHSSLKAILFYMPPNTKFRLNEWLSAFSLANNIILLAINADDSIPILTKKVSTLLLNIDTSVNSDKIFLDALFISQPYDQELIRQEATSRRLDLFRPHLVFLINPIFQGTTMISFPEIINCVSDILKKNSLNCTLAKNYRNSLIFLIQHQERLDNLSLVVMFREIIQQLKSIFPTDYFFLSSGRTYLTPDDFCKSYNEALRTFEICRKFITKDNLASYASTYDGIGVFDLLFILEDNPALKAYMNRILSPLIEYDKANNAKLLTTLETYLYSDKNVFETSEKLFIHRNTLKYRIKKIESIIGYPLDNAHYCTDLMLALYIHKLYI